MNNIDSNLMYALGNASNNPVSVPKAVALKMRLAKILSASGTNILDADYGPSHFTFGVERLDRTLAGHTEDEGLPFAALHELHTVKKEDRASTGAMALLMAERCREDKPVLWITESEEARRQGRLYPPGLVELGIDPNAIIHVDAPDSIAVLRAAADGVRNAAMGAVIAELTGRKPKGLDMTATRRLSLSTKQSGVMALLLRSGSDTDDPLPTAAFSRWEVQSAPSSPLEANAPGHSTFDITLLRHRSGLYGLSARLEWNREYRTFREQPREAAPDTGAVPALAADRAVDQKIRAA